MAYLNEIKKLVPNCTFLAFETVKDKLFFKAIIKNGKDTDRVRVQINCPLAEVNQKIYDDLLHILVSKQYEVNE
jgi:hypothetical protein